MHVLLSKASLKQLRKLSDDWEAGDTLQAVYLGCFGLWSLFGTLSPQKKTTCLKVIPKPQSKH